MSENPLHILLIEDNPGDARLLRVMLSEAGSVPVQVTHADRLSTGLTRLAATDADVILLDLSLPDSQGVETLSRMHAAAQEIPIVVLTGVEDETLGVTLVQAGAQDYLVKGQVTPAVLTRSLRYATERKRTEEALRTSEERYRSLVNTAGSVILVLSPDHTIVEWNREAEAVYGWRRDEVIGQDYFTLFLSPSTWDSVAADIVQVLSGKQTKGFENPIRARDGREHILWWNVTRLLDAHKQPIGIIAVGHDITEQKRAEEGRRLAEERFRSIFENAVEGIFQTTLAGRFLTVNPALARLHGYESPEQMIVAITDIARQIYVDPQRRAEFIRLMEEQRPLTGFESEIYRKDGSRIWVSESARAVRDPMGAIIGYEGVVENITERRQAAEQLQASFHLLRTLSRRLEVIREEERARIARELHDELGVGLTCLKMDLSRLPGMASGVDNSKDCAKTQAKIRAMIEDVDRTILSVQRIVTELRPAILDDLGLVAAVEWQAQDFQRRSGIVCRCTASAKDIALDRERATVVFRICQEALTNVARHARASGVTIRLEEHGDALLLEVKDDGLGIAQGKIGNAQSLGLLGMRERAELFGGRIDIAGQPGKGTTVTLRLPDIRPCHGGAAAVVPG